ncbi:hypothetical protein P7K49_032519, partial [Saguinus oedipus]
DLTELRPGTATATGEGLQQEMGGGGTAASVARRPLEVPSGKEGPSADSLAEVGQEPQWA